ncbi:amino acid adenylation domain-containing protein [Streptomyces sp. NPDC088846]|uniref:non-ribosomal peptide synthetase n=1 Tax=Streptomyces sp. NPDC088846 TaxID=3365908 RepID=UPI003829DF9C
MSTVSPSARDELRRELLQRRLRGPAGPRTQPAGIPTADRTRPLALSDGQQRLWFLSRMDPDSAEYAVPLALRLTGPLDEALLRRCLGLLVARHEALRTTYTADGGDPVQHIGPPSAVDLPTVTLGPPGEGPELEAVLREFVGRPFDLTTGPMLRALLIREDFERHVLVLNVHHIACDGWSYGVLLRELTALYSESGQAALAAPGLQYADFAQWQRSSPPSGADLAYWRERLAGLETLELPTDRPRPATRDTRGANLSFEVPAGIARAVTEAGRSAGATPFMTLLAVVQVVLGRHTGRDDLAVGTPVAGRTRSEFEDVVGFFTNTMVARGDLSGDPTFEELLRRTRLSVLRDYAHQDFPFAHLVRELAPERDLAHTPLYQVMFALYEGSGTPGRLGALSAEEVPVPSERAKCDLTVSFVQHPDGSLTGCLDYAVALFDRARIARMATHFTTLLSRLAEAPRTPLSSLEILAPDERERLLNTHNDTAHPYTPGLLHERITASAARNPDAVAVRCGDEELTYAELERRANHVAAALMARGVTVETPVGVLCERGTILLPVLLGILRTGAHYVPLDPGYPSQRQEFMLREAGARVLVTTSRYRGQLPPCDAEALYADELGYAGPCPAPLVDVAPDDLAYVIYTSGSTGRPKGVMITHRGVLHYLDWCYQAYRAWEGEGAPVHSSLSFDLTVTGLFLPLLAGTTVTLVPEDRHPVTGLAELLSSGRRFSFVKLTPAHLEPLKRCLPASAARAAGHLVVGGEQLTPQALSFWRELAPEVRVANEYGHTETSVANVINVLAAGDAVDTPVSVGRPIWNTEIYLLDEDMRPVPDGATGELYAGGAGVARGFVSRPALTAERYVPNPYGPGRLYRSGDLARYLPDGRLEFVGRTDHQVKVRGYRIELGEIESAIIAHPGVREAVVVVRDGGLAGYVSPAGTDVAELRSRLAELLPDHMVPGSLTALETLPLTANGKIDRAALPAPDRATSAAERVEPGDELELAVLRLWEDVLDARIGVTDNFFARGGHSLLAVSMVDRMKTLLGQDVALTDVFRTPTVRELCARLRNTGSGAAGCVVPLSPGSAGVPPLFLVPPTAGTPFPYLPLVQELEPERPVLGLQAVGYGPDEQPLFTIEEIAARYLAEIDEVYPEGPLFLAGWSMGGSVAYEMARQAERSGRPVGHLAVIDSTVLGVDAINSHLPEVRSTQPLEWFSRAVLRLEPDDLAALSPQHAMKELLDQARDQGMVSGLAQADAVNRMAGVYLANKEAINAYRCTAVIDCDIHLIRSRDEHPENGRPEVRPESWRMRTRGQLHDTVIDGDHWSIATPPYVTGLARVLGHGLRTG